MNPSKQHQRSSSEWQVRVDGKPVYFSASFDRSVLEKYAELCQSNSGCYVDVAKVSTEIMLSQYENHILRRFFANDTI